MAQTGVFLDTGSLGAALDWSALAASLDDWRWYKNTRGDEGRVRLGGAAVAVSNKVLLDAPTIAGADALELICVAATGVDNVDLEAASARGVPVVNVADYATDAVCQHVIALITGRATRWADYDRLVRAGGWSASEFFCRLDYPIASLAGQTLVIVGWGDIGAAVARVAKALGMAVVVAERPGAAAVRPGRVAFEQALERADVLSLHCPLTADTRHLIDGAALARMKPGAMLINTARGGLVDSAALAAALTAGDIAAAGIDVLAEEPPPADEPLLAGDVPNLIVTPHSAWASHAARQQVLDTLADKIRAFYAGEALATVNALG